MARALRAGKWGLSQYPSEGEILLPPLTALQMVGSVVERDLVIVAFTPTVMSAVIKTGGDDVMRFVISERERQREEEAVAAAAQVAEAACQRQAAADQAAQHWKLTMGETRRTAAQRMSSELLEARGKRAMRLMEEMERGVKESKKEKRKVARLG